MGEDPIQKFNLYGGVYTDEKDSSIQTTNSGTFPITVEDRNGNANNALTFIGNSFTMLIPPEKIQTITGDYTIELWIKTAQNQAYQTLLWFEPNDQFVGISLENEYLQIDQASINNFRSDVKFTLLDQWVKISLSYDSSTNFGTFYVNEQQFGSPIHLRSSGNPTQERMDLQNIGSVYVGAYIDGNDRLQGSIAEIAFYNSQLLDSAPYNPYQEDADALNELVSLSANCPAQKNQFNIGLSDQKKTCIADTCSANTVKLINYMRNNFTVSVEFTLSNETTWGDSVTFKHTLSDQTCGGGSNEECFQSTCFKELLVQVDENYTIAQIPEDSTLVDPSVDSTAFKDDSYSNSTLNTLCTTTSATDITCYYMIAVHFAGTYYDKSSLIATHTFSVNYKTVPGEDTLSADLSGQSFEAQSSTQNDPSETLFESAPSTLTGVLDWTSGSAPSQIEVGQVLELSLKADTDNQERDFKADSLTLSLVFLSDGSEVTLPATIVADSDTYVNDQNSTAGAVRSISFQFQPYVLGTYTIRAGATLKSQMARLLIEQTELENINQELQITVVKQQNQILIQGSILFLLLSVAFAIYLLNYSLAKKRNSTTQNKYSVVEESYENIEI